MLKNKGAILVLVWNSLIMSLFYRLTVYDPHKERYIMIWGLTLPIAGWLADVYCGRYRVILWSMWIMWAASILMTISSVVAQSVESYVNIDDIVMQVLLAIVAIGFGGYQANVIQFGIDQLHDASTTQIKSFISWYVWTYLSGGIAIEYALTCTSKQYRLLGLLLICTCLTIVLSLTLCLDGVLVKEPVTQNPFKLVFKVIHYAIRHKHPVLRSAFTYCEDDLPSRFDLGKSKYGGPFTTEQVEDVKTFLRLLSVVFIGCSMASGLLVVNRLRNHFQKLLMYSSLNTPSIQCYLNMTYTKSLFYSAVVLIPVNEFLIRPLLHKYFSWVESHRKFSVGVVLQISRVLTLVAFIITARYNHENDYRNNNSTIQCIFTEDYGTLASSFDIRWMTLPSFLNSISIAALGIGGVEFICAQTPYAMRGLISGAVYGSVAIFTVLGFGITQPFTMSLTAWSGTGTIISCGFWYLLLVILCLTFNGVVLFVLAKLYKNRKREDVLPNEQIFAEQYYSTLSP